MSYLEKYKPSNTSQVIGHKKIIEEVLKKWLTNWNNETKKSLLLSGSCGIGKTLIIEILLKELDFNNTLFSGEEYDKNYIETFIKTPFTLFNNKKNILFIDNLNYYNNTDISFFVSCIKKTKIPILFISNDAYNQTIKPLINYCINVKLTNPNNNEIFYGIKKLINLSIKDNELMDLIQNSNNDIRNILIQLDFKQVNKNKCNNTNKCDKKECNIFKITNEMFSQENTYETKYINYFYEPEIIQLMVQENYINNIIKTKNTLDTLFTISKSSNNISDIDIYETSKENFINMKSYIANACIYSTIDCSNIIFPNFTKFLSILSKKKVIKNTIQNVSQKIKFYNFNIFKLDYTSYFIILLFHNIIYNKNTSQTIINFINNFKLFNLDLKEDIQESLNIFCLNIDVYNNYNYKKIKSLTKTKIISHYT